MTTTTQVNVPNAGMDETAVTLLMDRGPEQIVFVRIMHDSDCGNPLEDCDGLGSIRSLSRRHSNQISTDEFEELTGFDPSTGEFKGGTDPDAVVLSYYEHGNCMWFVNGDARPGVEFRWDGVRVAGLWQPDDALKQEVKGMRKAKRRAKMVEFAKQACEEYTKWVNGECYGYDVRVYNLRLARGTEPFDQLDDYRHEKPLAEDSCWGFIGSEYVEREARDVALAMIQPKEEA